MLAAAQTTVSLSTLVSESMASALGMCLGLVQQTPAYINAGITAAHPACTLPGWWAAQDPHSRCWQQWAHRCLQL